MEAVRFRVKGEQRERGDGRGRRRGQRQGPVWRHVSDDIRATLVDHVINHGLSMREAGQRVHPNLSRYTVASIVRTFQLKNRYIFKFLLQTVPTVCVTWFCIILHYYCTNCTIQKWAVLWSVCKGTLLWCYSTVYSLKVQYVKKNLTNDTLWCNFLQNGVPSVPSGVPQSGRERLFTQLQGLAIIEMV